MRFYLGSIYVAIFVLTGCKATQSPDLVDVERAVPGVVLDIRYATTNNFTGQVLYPSSKCYLRSSTAQKLAHVQSQLRPMGLGLKVYDGYRPLSVQRKMWKVYPVPGYVADPKRGSRHNRGAAVDLTLIHTNGTEVPMPSPYDSFTETAHRNTTNAPPEALANRDLLERVMVTNGFEGLPTEWWHFDDLDWRRYPLMDIIPQ
ncbi:MAG: beta-glucosidase-related glycosidase and D-alanyl-D-alanine dipeptidase [Verrucomicrobiales bacterium]|nr:beta-glucosidase-related glycosidase and D-alanyl-D-alanine dipeptidase [Verrucomicrobiales bacterium]